MRWRRFAAATSVAAALTMVFPADQGAPEGGRGGGVLLAWTALPARQPVSVWSGVYTEEQATAGENVYFARCASCHGHDLGGIERSPALAGPLFLEAWHGKNLRRLIERIEGMPPDEPVSAAEAVDTLAFLLYMSEMPSGSTVLPADRARLADITFERAKP